MANFKFSECSASAAGESLNVIEANISSSINSIPCATLLCSPVSNNGGTQGYRASVSTVSALYKKMKPLDFSQGGSLKISVKNEGSEGKGFDINLTGWKLAGAGLSDVTMNSVPLLSIILYHPICDLTTFGPVYGIPKKELATKVDNAVSGKVGLLNIMEAVYGALQIDDFQKVEGSGNGESVVNSFVAKLKGSLTTYLDDQTNGTFLNLPAENVAKAIGRLVVPNQGSGSAWDTILALGGELMLNIVQDKSHNFMGGQLLLEPIVPWKPQSKTIEIKDTYSISFPGEDPLPIAAVASRMFSSVDEIDLGFNGRPNVNPQTIYAYADASKSSNGGRGKVLCVNAPRLLDSATSLAPSNGEKIDLAEIKAAFLEELKQGFNEQIKKFCQAVYETEFMAMSNARVTCVLDKDLYPGETCDVKAGGFLGRIVKVEHKVSMEPGAGSNVTTVWLDHVGSAGSRLGTKTKNAAYS